VNTTSASCNSPRCVADALGLSFLDAGDDGVDVELLRDLYRHARGEDGQRLLLSGDPSFKRGWVDLQTPRARELVSAFVALDDADDIKHARRIAQSNLEAHPWNDVLGIIDPPIQLKIKIHGVKWAMRFQSGVPTMRGQEQINEELPAIPGTEQPAATTVTSNSPPVISTERVQKETPATDSAADDVISNIFETENSKNV